ncbi:hypothetical protein CCHL11_06533 [Colletotrichum chlorophyti]|uniref:Uncharacterized protein n=1 Tax=Colletotrichum chlorophyti TaxID=708187 RepID=A0A1Q8RS96_9PEZI|nr:hypothetical protein CCHL11_06533 [Colletotrichum chlorophyti]
MPAVTHPELALDGPSTVRSYNHFPFHICVGLAVLVLLIVLRFVVHRHLRSGAYKNGNETKQHDPTIDDLSYLVNHQRLHHLFTHGGGWAMDEKSGGISSNINDAESRSTVGSSPDAILKAASEKETGGVGAPWKSDQLSMTGSSFGPGRTSSFISGGPLLSRPPPPPPLTPPKLSPSIFTYDERRRSFTGGVPELDASFFEQPNPDYMSSTSTATTTATQSTPAIRSSPTPRRRSYTKTLSITAPTPGSMPMLDDADVAPSPSSYPPTSPLLPGPPPVYGEIRYDENTMQEIVVRGEIISFMDDAGTGWRRHTRVYGSGVCLACAASGDEGHHGGFYGENVLPQEKRH